MYAIYGLVNFFHSGISHDGADFFVSWVRVRVKAAAVLSINAAQNKNKKNLEITPPRHHNFRNQFEKMKLDTHAIRYLTSEDWRVLTAVCFCHIWSES